MTDDRPPEEAVREAVREQAEALVPADPHERWRVFVDLAAYHGRDHMTAAAGEAVREVAERVLTVLLLGEDEV
jgi:hypothetical protein